MPATAPQVTYDRSLPEPNGILDWPKEKLSGQKEAGFRHRKSWAIATLFLGAAIAIGVGVGVWQSRRHSPSQPSMNRYEICVNFSGIAR